MIPETMECPSSHKFVMNVGLTCCNTKTSKHCCYQYYEPKENCDNWIDCPDQRRKCRNAPGKELMSYLEFLLD